MPNSTAWSSGVRSAGRVSRRLQLQPCQANRQEIPRHSCRGCFSATRAWSAPSTVSGLFLQAAATLGVRRRQDPEKIIDTNGVSLTFTEAQRQHQWQQRNIRNDNHITVFLGVYQMYNTLKGWTNNKNTNKTGPRELYTVHAEFIYEVSINFLRGGPHQVFTDGAPRTHDCFTHYCCCVEPWNQA